MKVCLEMTLSAIGFRPAARALAIVSPCLPNARSPSANTGNLWLLRFGLAEINRTKEQADDWVWFFDHTIQTGNGKCLVVIGIRISDWQAKKNAFLTEHPTGIFSLKHEDMTTWLIKRVDTSTGLDVCQDLESLCQATGIVPALLLSDQGTDVRNGGELFCAAAGRPTRQAHDIAHATANALKRQLHKDKSWLAFTSAANCFKTKIRQSRIAFLMPPDLKQKARWMNLATLIQWSERVERFLIDPEAGLAAASAKVEPEDVKRKLEWLQQYAPSLAVWRTMLLAVAVILNYIRNEGYHSGAAAALRAQLQSFRGAAVERVIAEVLLFVEKQSESAVGGPVPGSTEVLESLIGKGKQFLGKSKNGYTKSVLGIAASTAALTIENIKESLTRTTAKDVTTWVDEHIGKSLQSQRIAALPST